LARHACVVIPSDQVTSAAALDAARADLARSARLRREAALVVAGQVGASLAGLIGLRLLTTLLDPASFGRLALGLSIAAFLQQVAFGPISSATLRYAGTAHSEGQLAGFMRELLALLKLGILLAVVLAFAVVPVYAALGIDGWGGITISALWFAAASGVSTSLLFVDVSLRRRARAAILQVGIEVVRFGGAAILLVSRPSLAATGALAAFAGTVTLIALGQYAASRAGVIASAPVASNWSPQLRAFAAPLALTGALSWAQLASDRWSLNVFLSTADVGAYSVLYQIAVAPMSLLSVMLQQLIGPVVFRMAGRNRDTTGTDQGDRVVLWALAALGATTLTGAVVAWWLNDTVFAVVVGPRFRQFSYLLPLAVIAGGMLAASQLAATTVMSRGDTRRLIVPKVVTAILGVGLNVAGARLLGVRGVLLANAVYGLCYMLWMLLLARRPAATRQELTP
jgi:O-antigen/teichoic acid export membrane protein